MDRRPWTSRLLPALLIAATFSSLCGMGSLCAAFQASAGKCCCPVEGSSPCLDTPADDGAPAPEPEGTVDGSKRLSVEAPAAEPLVYSALELGRSPSILPHAPRAGNPPPVHLLCCVFLR